MCSRKIWQFYFYKWLHSSSQNNDKFTCYTRVCTTNLVNDIVYCVSLSKDLVKLCSTQLLYIFSGGGSFWKLSSIAISLGGCGTLQNMVCASLMVFPRLPAQQCGWVTFVTVSLIYDCCLLLQLAERVSYIQETLYGKVWLWNMYCACGNYLLTNHCDLVEFCTQIIQLHFNAIKKLIQPSWFYSCFCEVM